MASNEILASPPGDCCLKVVKHTGTPTGSTVSIGGLQTYISNPPDAFNNRGQKIVLFFPDVYGPFFVNNSLLIDYFASHGYLVVAPDYFEGDPIHVARERPDFVISEWIGPKMEFAKKAIPGWVNAVKEEYGTPTSKYGTTGYCFGAPFVMEYLTKDWVQAGAFAHPAFLDENHFRVITQPLLLSCAESDFTFSAEARRKAEDILQSKKAIYYLQIFSGVEHGFALRGNMDNENERWAKEGSAKSIVEWWNRFLLD
ncbi:alpha/beta-hydrolase [Sistotremastrum suecicum HHB10207 ss-3]|uniref:Alpha/beta-hydrolase n=1 Tax=Sistotremastrum suecicum HHB10207 ss-3 TaxID=1314776 RepID=A0A166IFV9_9AGAM|nr:alpha/beta-hydrolase [Sistotremastrum suecicum HHB10207 ss-3]